MEFPPSERPSMYVWSATGLPDGLSLLASACFQGSHQRAGTYSPQITVADASGNVAPLTQTFTLNIALAPLAFTTTTLTAIQNQSFSGKLSRRAARPHTASPCSLDRFPQACS